MYFQTQLLVLEQIGHAALDLLSIDVYAIDAASESHILLQKPVGTSVGLPHNQTLSGQQESSASNSQIGRDV